MKRCIAYVLVVFIVIVIAIGVSFGYPYYRASQSRNHVSSLTQHIESLGNYTVPQGNNQSRQLVILKADDFTLDEYGVLSAGWQRFIYYIEDSNLQVSIGIIGSSLENGDATYFSLIKAMNNRGNIEFWNHGYTHDEKHLEFQNTPYEFQLEHLTKTQSLAKEKLGITLHAFGAPENVKDGNTTKAVESVKDIDVWFGGNSTSPSLLTPTITISDMENGTGNISFENFLTDYDPNLKLVVFQFHPRQWNESQLGEFKQIIAYLISQEVTFVTPSEYLRIKQ